MLVTSRSRHALWVASGMAIITLGMAQLVAFVALFGRLWVPPIPDHIDPDIVGPFGVELFSIAPLLAVLALSHGVLLLLAGPDVSRRRARISAGFGLGLGFILGAGTVVDWWGGLTIDPVIPAINEIVEPLRILDLVTACLLIAIVAARDLSARRRHERRDVARSRAQPGEVF